MSLAIRGVPDLPGIALPHQPEAGHGDGLQRLFAELIAHVGDLRIDGRDVRRWFPQWRKSTYELTTVRSQAERPSGRQVEMDRPDLAAIHRDELSVRPTKTEKTSKARVAFDLSVCRWFRRTVPDSA
jgi:hypothetical protein